ncbi:glycosyltransferase family 2 protein [Paraburkholderia caffeinilytica]|uniref:glycosyltransferase family 2 protein n=1 Tax=Paraburkholderia caffeinilytica TaxID=1761016 RepID=UPI0038BAF0E6
MPDNENMMPNSSMMPLIGVVTVLFNSDDVLPGFFESMARQLGVRMHLYVIDNSASDSGAVLSRKLADSHGIQTTVVFKNANVGVARGNNQGIELALQDHCDLILLANNDTEFSPTTIRTLQDAVANGSSRVATPKIMYFDTSDLIWYAGGHVNPWTMRTPHYGDGQKDLGQFDIARKVGYAPTCFMMFDARVFGEVGRMDETYFVYYDDTDFVWRMAARGIAIHYVPQSVVLHKVSSSTGGGQSPFSLRYVNRNRLYFIRKNLVGFQRVFALAYALSTRIPKLFFLPPSLASHGWRGVREGLKMEVVKEKA